MFRLARKRWVSRRCCGVCLTRTFVSPVLSWGLFCASVLYIFLNRKNAPRVSGLDVGYQYSIAYAVVLDEELNLYEDIPDIGVEGSETVEVLWTAATPLELYSLYKRPSARCRKLVNMGGFGCTRRFEGNKDVCLDPAVVPPRGSCLAYSFGVADDVTFEDSLTTLLDCEVHLYDPTIRLVGWHLEKPRAKQIFHSEALYYRPAVGRVLGQTAVMKTFDTLLALNRHTETTIHYLKIDIEGDEWQVLEHMISYNLLDNVIQLSIELHSQDLKSMPKSSWMATLKERFRILHSLEEVGFRRVSVQDNQHYLCRVDFTGVSEGVASEEDAASYQASENAFRIEIQFQDPAAIVEGDINSRAYHRNRSYQSEALVENDRNLSNATNSSFNGTLKSMLSETVARPKMSHNIVDSSSHRVLKSENKVTEDANKFDSDIDGENENLLQVCQEVLYVKIPSHS